MSAILNRPTYRLDQLGGRTTTFTKHFSDDRALHPRSDADSSTIDVTTKNRARTMCPMAVQIVVCFAGKVFSDQFDPGKSGM